MEQRQRVSVQETKAYPKDLGALSGVCKPDVELVLAPDPDR
jgi:hypothetical protein